MRQMIIGFSKPTSFKLGAAIIQLFSNKSQFSHVYLRVYTSFADRNLVYQASHGCVNCITYSNFLIDNKAVAEFSYNMEDSRYKTAIQYCMDKLQRPYSYSGLLKIAARRLFGTKKSGDGEQSYICSELAARVLPEIYERDADYVQPLDLYKALSVSTIVMRIL